jgi:rhodanese-related sulfurtransferase
MTMSTAKSVSALDARRQVESGGVLLIDVRTPAEFHAGHAEGAVNVPLDTLSEERLSAIANGGAAGPVYVLCRSGARAKMGCERLAKAGRTNAVVVEGGTEAWDQAGLPMVRGTAKVISLERQVRIAAGSIVFVGALLAAFVHPWFWVVPAFVGGGLTFAGITDTCAMGMLLARMPWNQRGSAQCPS